MKYIYCYEKYGEELKRYRVEKETKSTIWIKMNPTRTTKISKKTYHIGSGWGYTYFMEETSELKTKYRKQKLYQTYKNKISELMNCRDELIMKKILEIEIPKNNKERNNATSKS